MSVQGYYRDPSVCGDTIVFLSEDDLWTVPLHGGTARRLTAVKGFAMLPVISPDGKQIAFTGTEEGHGEIYVMPIEGGHPRRVTYLGTGTVPLFWTDDSKKIVCQSSYKYTFESHLYAIDPETGEPEEIPVGPATCIAYGKKGVVIGRHTRDLARWKRYRGGTAGELWIDPDGTGDFHRMFEPKSNYNCPMWIGNRIYFLSDHEGISNVYSCTPQSKDLKRVSKQTEFYARSASTDGKTIVYHAGGDLFAIDVKSGKEWKIKVDYAGTRAQTNRKFVPAAKYLRHADLHPKGTHIAAEIRGKVCSFANWTGSVTFWGQPQGVRYRDPKWLQDGIHFVAVSDEFEGEDRILAVNTDKHQEILFKNLKPGRIHRMVPSPKQNLVAISNHRNDLLLFDLAKKTLNVVETSDFHRIQDPAWSPDGRWLAYGVFLEKMTRIIRIYDTQTKKKYDVTAPLFMDMEPVFSPDGKYLYYIGQRVFNPVYDAVQFDLGFLKSAMLFAISLKAETPSPFIPKVKSPAGDEDKPDSKDEKKGEKKDEKKEEELKVEIDFDGILRRSMPFPIKPGEYSDLTAFENKVYYLEWPRTGLPEDREEDAPRLTLKTFDFEKLGDEVLIPNVSDYRLSLRGSNMLVLRKGELSVYKTGEKPKEKVEKRFSLQGNDIDLSRVRTEIEPLEEWKQMYREAWLLQREHYWVEDMNGIDWKVIYKRYFPLLGRLGSRQEFSDLMWEMQGELGTSHCYEFGGDYEPVPSYPLGKLGCTYKYTPQGWAVDEVYYGDCCQSDEISPLALPGVNVQSGDIILAVNGRKLDAHTSPRHLLINQQGQEVTLTVKRKKAKKTEDVVVKALRFEQPLLYRQWVEKNRNYVHQQSKGRIGYVHVPDMGVHGYSEFHRLYLTECHYDALIVDVRYNGGGHVSQLLLQKLARKPIGYDMTRWSKEPETYPTSAVNGPIIAITNEYAGSDGDIFSHAFKLMKLGKLIGKRTWGGVVGINGQYSLADGTVTTQPEYSHWFKDVGWGVENYGTDPDIEVEILPKDHVAGKDPQLDKAIELLTADLKKMKVVKPDLKTRKSLSLPKLKF